MGQDHLCVREVVVFKHALIEELTHENALLKRMNGDDPWGDTSMTCSGVCHPSRISELHPQLWHRTTLTA